MIQVKSRGDGGDYDDNAASKVIGKGMFLFVAVIMCLLSYYLSAKLFIGYSYITVISYGS